LKSLGIHLLIEYYACDQNVLDDIDKIRESLLEAARASGATVLNHFFHRFSPQGVSGVVVIAESHIAIHTWPEYGYAAVDVFTCGERVNPWDAYYKLKELLGSKQTKVSEVTRGENYDLNAGVGASGYGSAP
jgi:S-adenosylmethionine decarboxylase